MRVAVLSDIHANVAALEAVLEAVAPYDALWVLGDTVGYGPDPDAVVDRLLQERAMAVKGNHDAAVLGQLDVNAFNDDAREAVHWTSERINAATREWLDAQPERRTELGFTLVHGSPRDPLWEYLYTVPVARQNLRAFDTRHCLVGHTHLPLVFREDEGHVEVIAPSGGSQLHLDSRRCILNPGGVGQPRDGDPRACAMTLDTESGLVEWHRVEYAITETQERMRRASLPPRLIARLEHGL
jgi:diadenosine tetraphosphatase ApaH/serine/threonine PP2A family protein phosphatase